MRIAVCDDCKEDALQLKAYLARHDVRIYNCAEELLTVVEGGQLHFDLYLLDIYIQESINGIELAGRLRKQERDAVICFVSTSDDFYREAYDLYAVQYLLKPVQEEKINRLLERVSGSLLRDKEKSLSFKWKGETGKIPYGKILYISSRGHTLSIYCKDKTVQECIGKLDELAIRICGEVFCRCHQSFLVNMYQVDSMSGNDLVISGSRIPVSRRYYTEVKKRYQEVLFEEVD